MPEMVGVIRLVLPSPQFSVTAWADGFPAVEYVIDTGTEVCTCVGLTGVLTNMMAGVMSAAPNAVPLSSVIFGVLVLLKTTVNRPPETVPSRLLLVFLMGFVPPSLLAGTHPAPSK